MGFKRHSSAVQQAGVESTEVMVGDADLLATTVIITASDRRERNLRDMYWQSAGEALRAGDVPRAVHYLSLAQQARRGSLTPRQKAHIDA